MTTTGQRSTTAHNFATIEGPVRMRSMFDRGHGIKTTMDSGYLVPLRCYEVYPGDQVSLNMTVFGRLATPKFPFMDNVFFDTFAFFVPYRILWDNWNYFMGEQKNPGDSIDFLMPQVVSAGPGGAGETDATNGGWAEQSLADYFNIPTKVPNLSCTAMPFRAYNLIWNEHFRSQDLQQSLPIVTDDGPDDISQYKLTRRGKRHDYFTSCLPFPQKGPAVLLPFSGTAPVQGFGVDQATQAVQAASVLRQTGGKKEASPSGQEWAGQTTQWRGYAKQDAGDGEWYPDIVTNFDDPSASITATINDLRESVQVQRLLERDARGGTRYAEIVQSHFGVVSPDARLQRPEYLGGSSVPVNVNPIAQTSETTGNSEQGRLAAIGTVLSRRNGFTKGFTEHGIIMLLCNVRADLNYQQGLPRWMSRRRRLEFYWPTLAHLGEQAVLNKEIFAQGADVVDGDGEPVDDGVFGYNERWSELRYEGSAVTGIYRSNAAQSLDVWHLSQDFANLPTLSDQFIQENPPLERVLEVVTEPQLKIDVDVKARWIRQLPMYGTPGFIDHF